MELVTLCAGIFLGGLFFKTQQEKHHKEVEELEKLRAAKDKSNNTIISNKNSNNRSNKNSNNSN